MLNWTSRFAALAFVVSIAAQPLHLQASQTSSTARQASAATTQCDEMNAKGRALVDAKKMEEARAYLTAAIPACPDKVRQAAGLVILGFAESSTQPQEALKHFRQAMALDPDNMRAPQNAGGMLISLGQHAEAVDVLEKALAHGTDDKPTLFRLEFNAGLALLNMCAARQPGCDGARAEAHFVRASELNPSVPDTFFNLAAITNDIHHDSRRAMQLFKKACDLGHQLACAQYEHFSAQLGALDRSTQSAPAEMTADALAAQIRRTYPCTSVVKSTRQGAEQGMVTWAVECVDNHLYTVIVGSTGETTVIQKK